MQYGPTLFRAALLMGAATLGTNSFAAQPTVPPDPPAFAAQGKITYVDRSAI